MNMYKHYPVTTRFRRAICFALLVVGLHITALPLLAQSSDGSAYLGVSLSRTPLHSVTAGSSVQLTRDADLSPFPSFIDYPSESASNTWMVGLTAGYRPLHAVGVAWRAHLETSYLYSALTDKGPSLDITTLEIGAGYFLPLGIHAGLEFGLAGMGGLATGHVGTVGSREGDIYLISPDDSERYETGSEIWTTGYGLGVDATVAAIIGPMSVTAGYRLTTPIDSWTYRVQDVDDTGRTSELPEEGFASNPPTYDLDGVYLRLGVIIPLGRSSRPEGPRTSTSIPQNTAPPPESSEPIFQPVVPEEVDSADNNAAEPPDFSRVPPPGPQRILWVQERLNSQGFDCGSEDGIMGQRTRNCIRALQRQWKLPATGELNDATLTVIRDL